MKTAYWQRTSATSYTVHVDACVDNGGYIADAYIAQGASLAPGGSNSAPYLRSF